MGDSLTFNIDNGYFDGLVRGFRSGILKRNDYHNLVECETLEGMLNIRSFSKYLDRYVFERTV